MSTAPAEPSGQEGTDASSPPARRGFLRTAADATDVLLLDGLASSAAPAPVRVQDGIGSVSTAPRPPAGFTKTFKSRFIEASGTHQHVVGGGDGPRGWCTAGPRTRTPGAS